MFLNQLEADEKRAFLQLAHYIARSDSEISDSEKSIIEKYCLEMQIENIEFNEEEFDIYDILSTFKSNKSKKIATLEILMLIYADEYLHENEREILEKMLEEFGLNNNFLILYTEWAKNIISLYKQGIALINL